MLSEEDTKRKRNILQIVPALNCGGVERGTIDIAKALKEAGDNPYVLSSGGSLCGNLHVLDATLIKHDVSTKNPLMIYKNISFMQNLIKKHNIDLVHARSRAPAWSAHYACKRENTPFVTTFHGIYSIKSKLKRYYNSVMTFGDRVIAVSNFVKKHMLENYKINPDIIRVIHRGVDLDYFAPQELSEQKRVKFMDKYNTSLASPIIIMPSRMTFWKGQHVLIEALAKIKHLDFYCILAGDVANHPDYVKKLRDMIVHFKLQSKVQIFGQETDVAFLYNAANIVVSASIEPEAFGRSIVEAQSMQKLVIATNIGGAAETIENEVTGFHVKPNDPDEMADRIKYALSIIGTSEEEKITTLARKSVSKYFSLKQMQKKTLDVYNELI
ncbi:MAG: glycosyltransferase family 4 protein [Rickettsiaceae bacterium]|nr:glycosyltransferase family 4 protein [Rickettsiaceae bacterium]